jgi:hypothetical protein
VAPGIDVLLGSDSLLTGDGSLLDELRLARATGLLSDERLEDAVGVIAARRLGLAPPSLVYGARADLVVLRRPLLDAGVQDVAVVIVDGVLRVLDEALAGTIPIAGQGRVVEAHGVIRRVWDQRWRSSGGLPDAARQVTAPLSIRRSLTW